MSDASPEPIFGQICHFPEGMPLPAWWQWLEPASGVEPPPGGIVTRKAIYLPGHQFSSPDGFIGMRALADAFKAAAVPAPEVAWTLPDMRDAPPC